MSKKMVPLKFANHMIGFREVPNEISILINVSNCPYRCDECHSPELQGDNGLPLTIEALDGLITFYNLQGKVPITCICFMGDGGNRPEIGKLVKHCHDKGFLTCLYTGSTNVCEAVKCSDNTLDFIKVGTYMKEHGPLNSPTTNQKFYEIHYRGDTNGEEWFLLEDITNLFQKSKQDEN